MVTDKDELWRVEFYRDRRGRSPVTEFLARLGARERAKVARYLQLLREFGPTLAMPQARHIKGPLWELRPDAYRLLYVALRHRRIVILHAFRKKTQQTPRREIEEAIRRLADLTARES